MGKQVFIKLSTLSALTLLTCQVWAAPKPVNLYGNLGFYYTYARADGGAQGENNFVVGTLNADSYIWKPWFVTLKLGGTSTASYSTVGENTQENYLLSSRADMRILPKSRMPLSLSFYSNNNLDPNTSDDSFGYDKYKLGYDLKTRFFGARQSFIGRSGNQMDLWYQNRLRGAKGIGGLIDETVGAKIKSRYANHNLYVNGTYQVRERNESLFSTYVKTNEFGSLDKTSINRNASFMHHYVPSSQFYVKTLANHTNVNNQTEQTNGSYITDSTTGVNQASSFLYWRPVYKPYVVNAAARAHRRELTNNTTEKYDDNIGLNAYVAGTYEVNRRTQLTASVSGGTLDTAISNSISTNQSIQLRYQSDAILYEGFNYRWFSNTGIGNDMGSDKLKITDEPESRSIDLSQNLNAGIGHNANKRWVTGNRSVMRTSFTQQAREYFVTEDFGSIFTISHTGNLSWNLDARQGAAYFQMTAMDTRSFFDNTLEMQILNVQLSRSFPIDRMSAWSSNLSLQSSRREDGDSGKSFVKGFLTVATGRLSYQHGRLFGIYKLKFRTKLDLSATANRDGGDRMQADLEGKLSYHIGKLSAAVVGRLLESDTGLGSRALILQINRNF